jgi:hypothetical protein
MIPQEPRLRTGIVYSCKELAGLGVAPVLTAGAEVHFGITRIFGAGNERYLMEPADGNWRCTFGYLI